jgi:small subunit ribosomal protein S20
MPNIKQQKRRVSIAARQRMENLRHRSSAKTLYKRLETALADGDKDGAAQAHRELIRCLDKASAAHAMHPNRAARKKSQAARLVAGS